MSLPLSRPSLSTSSSSSPSPPTIDARLLRLHAAFAHLDSISPDHPASQSLTLPKLKDALTTLSNYTFTPALPPPSAATAATGPLADKRRRRVAEEERGVQDMLDAVDRTRNGRIEFGEFVQLMEEEEGAGGEDKRSGAQGDEDDEWRPTKDVRPCGEITFGWAVGGVMQIPGADECCVWPLCVLLCVCVCVCRIFVVCSRSSTATKTGQPANPTQPSTQWRPLRSTHSLMLIGVIVDLHRYISLAELKEMLRTNGIDYYTDDQIQQMVSNQHRNPHSQPSPLRYNPAAFSVVRNVLRLLCLQALAVDSQALNAKGISLVAFSRLLTQSAAQS